MVLQKVQQSLGLKARGANVQVGYENGPQAGPVQGHLIVVMRVLIVCNA
jgi:hypothetical protein